MPRLLPIILLTALLLAAGCRGEPPAEEAGAGEETSSGDPTTTATPAPESQTPPTSDALPEPPATVDEPPEPDSRPGQWSAELGAVALHGADGVVVLEPRPLLEWIGRGRARMRATANGARTRFDGLLEQIPAPFSVFVDPTRWAQQGFDVERPMAVFLDVGPDDVMQIFEALQYEALTSAGGDPATRGAQIGVALENLTVHVRIALPITDAERAGDFVQQLLEQAGFEIGTTDQIPVSTNGKLFRRGSSVVRLEHDTDLELLVVDAVATQSADTLAGAGAVLKAEAAAAAGDPLPAPRTGAMLHAAASTRALAGIDAMQSTLDQEGGRSLEPVLRRLLHHSAFDAVTLTLDTHHITLTGRFTDARDDLVAALTAAPRLPLPDFDATPVAALETTSLLAANTGPWADAGLTLPETMHADALGAVEQLGPMALAVPLWAPTLPSAAWSQLDQGWRALDPADGYALQLVIPDGFAPTSPDTWLMAGHLAAPPEVTAETLATKLSCVAQGKPGTDCEPAPTVGQTVELSSPIVDPVRLRIDPGDTRATVTVATTEALLAATPDVATERAATDGRTPVLHAVVDTGAVAGMLNVPPAIAHGADLVDALDLQITVDPASLDLVVTATGELPLGAALLQAVVPMIVLGGR